MSDLLLAAHAAATWGMTGVIWVVQIVHYPLFGRVGREEFPGYARAHAARVIPLAAPLMVAEAATAIAILFRTPAGVPPEQALAGAGLLAAIWLCTAMVQLPQHARLRRGYDDAVARALVRWNWVRTILWSVRALLAAAWIVPPGSR